jgi:hypothetical protein
MKTTEESSPSTGSTIVRDRPGSARVAFTYRKQRSFSMSNEVERGTIIYLPKPHKMVRKPSNAFIDAAPLPISSKNRVSKLRQFFDQPVMPEDDRAAKDDSGLPVEQASSTSPTSSDCGKQRCTEKCDAFREKRREESKSIGFALVFFASNHKIQLFYRPV